MMVMGDLRDKFSEDFRFKFQIYFADLRFRFKISVDGPMEKREGKNLSEGEC